MKHLYTIKTKKIIGPFKRFIMELLGVEFINHYHSNYGGKK